MDPLTKRRLPVFVIAVVGDNLQQNENGTLSHPFFFNCQLDSWLTVVGIVESVTECAFVEPISRRRQEFLNMRVCLQVKIALLPPCLLATTVQMYCFAGSANWERRCYVGPNFIFNPTPNTKSSGHERAWRTTTRRNSTGMGTSVGRTSVG